MEWQANWEGPLQSYLQRFDGLLLDARTRRTFQESIKGIMAAGTLICQRIAACSPLLSKAKDGAQRILRLASGESTKRKPRGCRASDGATAGGGRRATGPGARGRTVANC
jgi:hypothetical protein